MRRMLLTVAFTMALAISATGAPREAWFFGGSGGDGGGVIPPLSLAGSQQPPSQGPHLSANGPVVVVLTVVAERPEQCAPRLAVIRLGGKILSVARLHPGQPTTLAVPDVAGLQLDVLGTGALGVPVSVGSAVRIVAP